MLSSRRKYADHPDVIQAGASAFKAIKETWIDQNNPTPEEEVAAKNARLQAMIDAAQAMVDAE